jgi:phosphoglycolate phosphatase-like HAD superfamily hydrolase
MNIEIAHPDAPRGRFRFALFDFDGTLSLIREGWQNVMVPYFVKKLLATPRCESAEQVELVVREFVSRLTGKQTIYQCFQLVEELQKRGGTPDEPLVYKHEYLALLWTRIKDRIAALKAGTIAPDRLLLPGSVAFLEALQERRLTLYLASGTDIHYVLDEARALQIDHFFGKHIYGALDNYQAFSKRQIIERILSDHSLSGPELLVVGDGYVEIENARDVGGFALGVASDEANPGSLDAWKRQRLLKAGADIIVRDYENIGELMSYLFPP